MYKFLVFMGVHISNINFTLYVSKSTAWQGLVFSGLQQTTSRHIQVNMAVYLFIL